MQFVTSGLKIMVVESDRTVLEMIQIRLDVAGYHTFAARTGQAAVELMRNSRPGALITEIKFPDMSGLDLIEVVRDLHGPALPIIMMGRQIGADDLRRAAQLGVRDCVAKPFGGAEILDRLARLTKRPAPVGGGVRAVAWV